MVPSIPWKWPLRIHNILISVYRPLQFWHELFAIRPTGPDCCGSVKSESASWRTGPIHRSSDVVMHLLDSLLLGLGGQDGKLLACNI